MGNKVIPLTEEVYNMLVQEKREAESFADVIARLSKRAARREAVKCLDTDFLVAILRGMTLVTRNVDHF